MRSASLQERTKREPLRQRLHEAALRCMPVCYHRVQRHWPCDRHNEVFVVRLRKQGLLCRAMLASLRLCVEMRDVLPCSGSWLCNHGLLHASRQKRMAASGNKLTIVINLATASASLKHASIATPPASSIVTQKKTSFLLAQDFGCISAASMYTTSRLHPPAALPNVDQPATGIAAHSQPPDLFTRQQNQRRKLYTSLSSPDYKTVLATKHDIWSATLRAAQNAAQKHASPHNVHADVQTNVEHPILHQ